MGKFFKAIACLRHFFLAKNRHDIHSPFVFDFVETIINARGNCVDTISIISHLSDFQKKMINRIIAHYQPTSIYLDLQQIEFGQKNPSPNFDRLMVFNETSNVSAHFAQNDFVIICNIHNNAEAQKNWTKLLEVPTITCSLDLYELGILLFRRDFKERQHYILSI